MSDKTILETYSQLMAAVRQAFESSGLTEDEAVELFEAEKHALRQESAT